MSQFHPTNVTIDPPVPPDSLAGAVLQGLSRPIGMNLAPGVLKTMFWAVASFGVVPLFAWARSFRAFATAEQQQFLHLAQWLRGHSTHPLAKRLEEHARELRPRGWLTAASILALLAAAAFIVLAIDAYPRHPWDLLLAGTYQHGYRVRRLDVLNEIFAVWCFGLGFAYFLHYLQVQFHAADVRRFVARFSEIAVAEGANRVKAETLGLGLRPLWLVAAYLLWQWGAPWGALAMLAGALQRRYITWTSRNTRADVAQRLRTILLRHRPSSQYPLPVYLRDRCVEPKCRAEVPRGVNFCPRCGTRQRSSTTGRIV